MHGWRQIHTLWTHTHLTDYVHRNIKRQVRECSQQHSSWQPQIWNNPSQQQKKLIQRIQQWNQINYSYTWHHGWMSQIYTINERKKVKVKLLSHVRLFVIPWTVIHQASLSMGFSRQEHWSRLPFPPPGDLPNPGIEPRSPALQTDNLPSEPPGKPERRWIQRICAIWFNSPKIQI